MQLIQLTEPAAIDIRKTMSTIRESLETNQLNGIVTDIGIDKSIATSQSKSDTVSKTDEDVINENAVEEQWEETSKDLDGIAIANGVAQNEDQKLELDNKHRVIEKIENGSAANGQSKGGSTFSEHCKSPSNISVDVLDKHTDLKDLISSVSIINVDVVDAKEVTSDVKITNVSAENSSAVKDDLLDTQVDVCIEKVSEADKLKNIDISVRVQDMSENVSAFSPNSNADEKEINISAQLQQLEDDASTQDDTNQSTDVKIPTGHERNIIQKEVEGNELENVAVPVEEKENKIQATTSSQKEINDGDITEKTIEKDLAESHNQIVDTKIYVNSQVSVEKQPKEVKLDNEKEIPGENLKIPTDKEPENSLVPQENFLVTDAVVDKAAASIKVVDYDLDHDIIDDRKYDEASEVTVEKQSVNNDFEDINSDSLMEVDIIPVSVEEKLKTITNLDTDIDTASAPKYIKVRSFFDMTDQTAMKNDETYEISKENQPQQNEMMDVAETDIVSLVIPEDNIGSDTVAYQTNIIEEETVVENHIKMANKENTKDTSEEIKNESLEVTEDINIEVNDSAVMEIDDVNEVPIVQKPGYNTADTVEARNAIEVKSDEETAKQDALINITDTEDEKVNKSKHTDSEEKNFDASEVISIDDSVKDAEHFEKSSEVKVMDKEVIQANEEVNQEKENVPEKKVEKTLPVVCKLSNTMDILSDDEDENPVVKPSVEKNKESNESKKIEEENKCINIDDDDDIMFIEDTNSLGPEDEEKKSDEETNKVESQRNEAPDHKINTDTGENEKSSINLKDVAPKIIENDDSTPIEIISQKKEDITIPVEPSEIKESKPPLLTKSFLKSVTKNLADMTRNELEDFCILKLVESVVDKSNLNEVKNKMKTMAITVEDLRKKTLALTKQNRDLQVVVKTVQEDQKKRNTNPMMPMKITRSVGMQVVLTGAGEKSILKKKLTMPIQTPPAIPVRPVRNIQSPKTQKQTANNIPVPRLVPASSPTIKSPATPVNTVAKPATPTVRNTTPQRPEKRPHAKLSSPASSVTVDLTDDEPPAKVITKNPAPPVRLVPSQNLMPVKNKQQFGPTGNSPRKVYIPISSNNQNIRPGTGVIRNFVSPATRTRPPSVVRMQSVRLNQAPSANRHPAPLPDAMKQYQPPTWKALPPAPDLKLSKVDNGIVISWKFEGYQQDTYEEVASFQLYAYQETSAPPSSALWKKIGDIKALPLPMACTLTQFMSGFKYYFAVRAIDVRSRIGPFSLPGSIMLISKS